LGYWFEISGLKLNGEKTKFTRFHTPQSSVLNNETFTTDDNTKFLGLYVDKHLAWGQCIESVIGKLNSACFQILCLRNSVDLKTCVMLYYAYFYSIAQYGIEFWGFSSETERVFRIQKKFLRIITFSPWKTSCKSIYRDLKIMTIPDLTIYKTLLMVQTNYNSFFNENFEHIYNTRFKNDFQYPKHRLKLVEKTPKYMGKNFLISCHKA